MSTSKSQGDDARVNSVRENSTTQINVSEASGNSKWPPEASGILVIWKSLVSIPFVILCEVYLE